MYAVKYSGHGKIVLEIVAICTVQQILLMVFKGLSILDLCPVNMSIPGPRRGALQINPKIHSDNFLGNGSHDFD
jgi:hypothetical protein